MIDLFIMAGETSGDVQGAHLVRALLDKAPHLTIRGVAGPRLRELHIQGSAAMEELQVMGFIDVFLALPRLTRLFFKIRNDILRTNPRVVLCIDYPGFNLRLERSLRKKGYQGKLIHFACPTVWAWGKKRIPLMAKHLDLLFALFPFEPACFSSTSLKVSYVGHPLTTKVKQAKETPDFFTRYSLDPIQPIVSLFPGSRKAPMERNFPLQLKIAQRLQKSDPSLQIALSLAHEGMRAHLNAFPYALIEPEHRYDLMRASRLALATSGTVALELALLKTPTIVQYAIKPWDVWLATKVFKIQLPHYCIVNLLAQKRVFPEFFGPNLTELALWEAAKQLWYREEMREQCQTGCEEVIALLGSKDASEQAAEEILQRVFRHRNLSY